MSHTEIKQAVNEALLEREMINVLFGTNRAKDIVREECRKQCEKQQQSWQVTSTQRTKEQCRKHYQEWENKMESKLDETARKTVKVHFRDFLDSSVQVNNILQAHTQYLQNTLEQTAENVLDSTRAVMFTIVSDPQHNEVVNMHLRYVSEQTNNEITRCQAQVNSSLIQNKALADKVLVEIKADYEKKVAALQSQLSKLEETHRFVQTAKVQAEKDRNEMRWGLLITNLAVFGLGCCLLFRK